MADEAGRVWLRARVPCAGFLGGEPGGGPAGRPHHIRGRGGAAARCVHTWHVHNLR